MSGAPHATTKNSKPRLVQKPLCPICRNPASAEYRPFCSKRCADVDLNRWLQGAYAVLGEPAAEEPSSPESGRGPRQAEDDSL